MLPCFRQVAHETMRIAIINLAIHECFVFDPILYVNFINYIIYSQQNTFNKDHKFSFIFYPLASLFMIIFNIALLRILFIISILMERIFKSHLLNLKI